MSENYESILEAAQRLPAEQRRRLAEQLLEEVGKAAAQDSSTRWRLSPELIEKVGPTAGREVERGKARRHFGAWDSGDERSADNERIDLDLAREYENSRRP
jgi:hypothetical protein